MPKNKASKSFRGGKSKTSSISPASGSQPSSQQRYRPLAPRADPSSPSYVSPGVSSLQSDTEKPVNKGRELTFVNMTDPSQSQNQETRKLIRTQVMRIFARERRMRETLQHKRKSPERPTQTMALPSPRIMCECPSPSTRLGQQDPSTRHIICSTCHGSVSQLPTQTEDLPLSSSPTAPEGAASGPDWGSEWSNHQTAMPTVLNPSLRLVPWPILMDPYMLDLISRMLLPGFRANEPLYGLSLFSHRPGAPQYPFSVDISSRDGNFGKVDSNSWTPWLALAVASPALIHLTLMLAASHVSVKEDSEYGNAALIAYHKDRALVCLHQLLEDYNQTFSDEAIAAAAVLACYELMCQDYNSFQSHIEGLSQLLEVRGGIAGLDPDGVILKIISWTDTVGAFLLSTRPYFTDLIQSPVVEPRNPFSIHNSPNLASHSLPNSKLYHAVHTNRISNELFRAIRQAASIATTLTSTTRSTEQPSATTLITTRDLLIHRLLSLATISPKTWPVAECLRLALLAHTISTLFTPALPPAYHRLIAHALRNLTATLDETGFGSWDCHAEILLWVHLVGFGAVKVAIAGLREEGGRVSGSDVEGYEEDLVGKQDYFAKKIELMCCFLGVGNARDVLDVLEREGLSVREDEEGMEGVLTEVRGCG